MAQLLDGPTLKQLLERVVAIAGERRVIRRRRLRVDTTVVETNIHYPTDRTLLADGVRGPQDQQVVGTSGSLDRVMRSGEWFDGTRR